MKTKQRFAHAIAAVFIATFVSACFEEEKSEDHIANGGLAVEFTDPADAEFIQTSDVVVNLFGTVTSASEVEIVEWENNRGGKGKANGKSNWVTGNIVLKVGTNRITVTARDINGQAASRTLTVERKNGPDNDDGAGETVDNGNDTVGTGIATLSWISPTQRADGSPLTDLAGFNIYYGTEPGDYDNKIVVENPGITTYVVENLAPGTWHFVLTAVDASGVESTPSNMKSRTL